MLYDDFVKKYYENKEVKEQRIVKLIEKIKKVFDQLKKNNNASDKEIWNEFFSSADLIKILFQSEENKPYEGFAFISIRSQIKQFISFLNENNLIDDVENKLAFVSSIKYEDAINIEDFKHIFYKDIESLVQSIDCVGNYYHIIASEHKPKLGEYKPEEELLYIKTVAILAWHGFTVKEMSELKKNDLIHIGEDYCIKYKNNNVQIDPFSYNIIKKYILSKSHRNIPGRVIINYKDSNKIIRLKTKNVTVNTILSSIRSFNDYSCVTPYQYRLNLASLRQCSIFDKMYKKLQNSCLTINQVARLYNNSQDVASIYHLINKYKIWENFFYPEQ